MSIWKVRVDVITQVPGKSAERRARWLLVEAGDIDQAEDIAKGAALKRIFGPRVVAVEWRQTSSTELPFDLTEWEQDRRKGRL